MARLTGAVAFFDIGNTLASVTIAPSGDRIEELRAYPYVPGVLGRLRDRGVRLGIISNRGPLLASDVNQALETAGLWDFFDPALVIYGPKDSPRIFTDAAARAGSPEYVLFVGEDHRERALALQAGFLVAPHPRLALPILERPQPLRYIRVIVPPVHAGEDWRAALEDLPLVPLHITGHEGTTIYAVATPEAAARLDDLGFWVDRLGAEGEPLTTDLYLLRDDRQLASGFLTLDGNSMEFFESGPATRNVLASTAEGLFVAVPAGDSIESYHFSSARHGHNVKLVPTPVPIDHGAEPSRLTEARAGDVTISSAGLDILNSTIQPGRIAQHVERYAGAQPAGSSGVLIKSRHVNHTDNATAVDALVADLDQIGGGSFAVRRHRFMHEGRPLENVIAELPGRDLDGVVLVTAHMDATGSRQPGYQPALDPAPGADDDASGVAGVLVAAEAILALDAMLAGAPRRTIQFAAFNAEEQGLVGSKAYARDQALLATPIVAVFQMDMIGYDVLPERTFELHAGFTPSAAVQSGSMALAQVMAKLVPQVSPDLPAPQIYPADSEVDPGERRSDHYSFQLQGYSACLASEDLFAGPGPSAPQAEMNPNYHLPTDAVVNTDYAADIARVVAAAAWTIATR
jgi:hypothetical protein